MPTFSNRDLSLRLERAEGHASAQFAAARKRLFPESGAEQIEYAGANVVFDGIDSPVTQTFGLGLFEALTADSLDVIERFFLDRGAPVFHEVSPFVGAAALDLLCRRNYRPIEISSVLYQPLRLQPAAIHNPAIGVHVITSEEAELWTKINSLGWGEEHPELIDFLQQTSRTLLAREHAACFLASIDNQPAAAGALTMYQGVGLLAGAATVPEFRRRGLQAALLESRLRYAAEQGCDLAMMVAEIGSNSQRNAERKGFKIAYTRLKWRLDTLQVL
jgi:GNAT superfamily N-acetyltransferase